MPIFCNDGITIAKEIEFEHAEANLDAQVAALPAAMINLQFADIRMAK